MKRYNKALFFISILFLIILFINPISVKGITLSSINYTFANDNLYNSTNINFNENDNVNVRNSSEYSQVYPATYSFTEDTGGVPDGWISESTGASDIFVRSLKEYHSEVMQVEDEGVNTQAIVYNTFDSSQVSGTIEFWVLSTNVSKFLGLTLSIRNEVDNHAIVFFITDDVFKYYDGGSIQIITTILPENNVWYHIRFDIETGGGGYLGLGSDKYFFTINGIGFGELDLRSPATSITKFHISTPLEETDYSIYFDAIGYSWEGYVIGSNIFPLIESFPFYEVNTFEFDMITSNILYDIGVDNPSGWSDIENGFDHTNIAQDNTDVSGGSRTNHRVVQIEGIGANHEITGLEKGFDDINKIINITMNYNFTEVSNDNGGFNISVYSNNFELQLKIGLHFPNSGIFGGQLTYLNSEGKYINLNDYTTSKIHQEQDINYYIYIDSFVIFRITTEGSLGSSDATYYFSLINNTNIGLGKIEIVNQASNDAGNDNIVAIKNIGIYSNNTSLSNDFGYLPLRLKDSSTFWIYQAHNLFRIDAIGLFSINTASFDDWIFGGNMEILTKLYTFNNTLRAINLYFIDFVHFPPIGIFDPIIVFFIKSQFNVSSITIDGIKFFDDTPHDFGFATYESGGVDNNKSYFFIDEVNKVQYNHYTDQNNVNEFIQMEFVVGGISTNSSAVQFSTTKSNIAYGFFRVNYISTSSIFEIPFIRKTTTSLLPNDKSIISYIVLITDNNDNTISGLTTGSISKFSLLFTDDIITEVLILSLLGVLIPLIIIIIPSLAFRVRYGKFLLAPFFLLMSIVCVIGGIIPTWLFFIIVISLSLFIFQKNEVENNRNF